MKLFSKNKIVPELTAPDLEDKLKIAEKRLEAAGREFHKKKSVCGLTAIELVLDGLRSGKLRKEDL